MKIILKFDHLFILHEWSDLNTPAFPKNVYLR